MDPDDDERDAELERERSLSDLEQAFGERGRVIDEAGRLGTDDETDPEADHDRGDQSVEDPPGTGSGE